MAGKRITLSLDEVRKIEEFYVAYFELCGTHASFAAEMLSRLSNEQELPPHQTNLVKPYIHALVSASETLPLVYHIAMEAKRECGVQLTETAAKEIVRGVLAGIKKELH